MNKRPENKVKPYSEKLKDPRWQKIRLQTFERDKWECQSCNDKESTLVVHHKYYLPEREPWEYPMDAFIALCEKCHGEERENRPQAEQTLLLAIRKKGFLFRDVKELAEGFEDLELRESPWIVATAYRGALADPKTQDLLINEFLAWCDKEDREAEKK